jgi:hypothetical protein
MLGTLIEASHDGAALEMVRDVVLERKRQVDAVDHRSYGHVPIVHDEWRAHADRGLVAFVESRRYTRRIPCRC